MTLFDFLSMKKDVNVASKSNKQKNCVEKLVLKVNDENSRIRILDPDPVIFVIDLQDDSKKLIFKHNFFYLLLLEATFTSFFKD